MDIGDTEGLQSTDDQADDQHGSNRQPHVHAGGHQQRAHGASEAHHGADAQVDVAAGEDTQQHTGSQNEHIGVLGDQVGDILGQQGRRSRRRQPETGSSPAPGAL